jgi:hypothetical protein
MLSDLLRVTKMLRCIQLEKFAYSAHILLFGGVWKRVNAFPPEQSAKLKSPTSPDGFVVTASRRLV